MKLPTPQQTDNPITWGRSRLLRWPTLCLWSVFLSNKCTSYLSLCLSLNSFCDETSRTGASLSSETRYATSVKRRWVQVPICIARFQYQSSLSLPYKDMERRWPHASQEGRSHWKLNAARTLILDFPATRTVRK